MQVFIDANIYLNLISDPNEKRLDDLEKLVEKKNIKLVFPRITEEEILRKIPFVTNRYWEDNIQKQAPNRSLLELSVIKENEKLEEIETARKQYLSKLNELRNYYIETIKDFKKRLKKLKSHAISTPEIEEIITKAKNRRLRGNPPGGNKIGDDLVWEILLDYCRDDDLIIVSNDPDWRDEFRSLKEKHYLNPLLEEEWSSSSKTVILYRTLGEFLKFYAKVDVSEKEIEKEKLFTGSLVSLGSLPTTVVAPLPGTNTFASYVPGTAEFNFLGYCGSCGGVRDNVSYPVCINCWNRGQI